METERIINYLILKNISDQEFDCPVSQKMRIAYIKAKSEYEKMSLFKKKEIVNMLNKKGYENGRTDRNRTGE
tara:strand:+ start:480 stop:695 length:216 start_codon:yes stop_codon:yes gene_type:complete